MSRSASPALTTLSVSRRGDAVKLALPLGGRLLLWGPFLPGGPPLVMRPPRAVGGVVLAGEVYVEPLAVEGAEAEDFVEVGCSCCCDGAMRRIRLAPQPQEARIARRGNPLELSARPVRYRSALAAAVVRGPVRGFDYLPDPLAPHPAPYDAAALRSAAACTLDALGLDLPTVLRAEALLAGEAATARDFARLPQLGWLLPRGDELLRH